MKRRPNLTLSVWFGTLALISSSCETPSQPLDPPRQILLQPGTVYRMVFGTAVDKFDIGTLFEDSVQLYLSPLAPMYRKSVIIKADDLRARVSPNWRRFINWAEDRSYSVGLGLICNSLAIAPDSDIDYLKALARWGFELWLHGWDHEIGEETAEFQGHSLARQKRHINASLSWAERKLGITLTTFGAPGNRSDRATALALQSSPQLKVWFDSGTARSVQDVIGIDWIAESTTGRLRSFEDYTERVTNLSENDVIVLQIHPAEWNDSDLGLFGRMVDHSVHSLERRLMTPYGYYRWRRDRSALTIEKVGEREYRIDCTATRFAHGLETVEEPFLLEEMSHAKVLGE